MKILVAGGFGKQGSVIARDLIYQSTRYQVSIADKGKPNPSMILAGIDNIINGDLRDYDVLKHLFADYDLVICALPADLGYNCVKAAVATDTNIVDLSFTSEDLLIFDQEAKSKGLTIIIDAGVAPGLSNLVVGRAMLQNPSNIEIIVGGIPQDRHIPFGYTITWSLDDLVAQYTRPARILVDGAIQTIPALSGVEKVKIGAEQDGYEAFYTDGLRSLLTNNGGVPNLTEKTLRWSGHIKQISPYLTNHSDCLKDEMIKQCKVNDPDVLIMRIKVDDEEVTMVAKSDRHRSAMARGTALTCSAFASLIASRTLTLTGVLPPEKTAADDKVYKAVLDKLEPHGVVFSTKYPFI